MGPVAGQRGGEAVALELRGSTPGMLLREPVGVAGAAAPARGPGGGGRWSGAADLGVHVGRGHGRRDHECGRNDPFPTSSADPTNATTSISARCPHLADSRWFVARPPDHRPMTPLRPAPRRSPVEVGTSQAAAAEIVIDRFPRGPAAQRREQPADDEQLLGPRVGHRRDHHAGSRHQWSSSSEGTTARSYPQGAGDQVEAEARHADHRRQPEGREQGPPGTRAVQAHRARSGPGAHQRRSPSAPDATSCSDEGSGAVRSTDGRWRAAG